MCVQSAVKKQQQVVTELEREHVMSGNLDQLVEEQRRIDAEKDAEVRRWRWRGGKVRG